MHARRALVGLPLILALACSPGGDEAPPQPAPAGSDASAGDETPASGGEEPSEEGVVTGQPSAELEGSCEPKPQGEPGAEVLVAELRVVNTGNLGVKVQVASRWPINRANGLSRWRRVRVPAGETLDVTVRMPVDEATARGVKRAVDRGRTCTTRSRVTGAFGMPDEG